MLPPPITDVLYTDRTWLSLLMEKDLSDMEAMAREPDTFKYIKKLRVMDARAYTQFLHAKLEQIRTNTGYHWAVWLRSSNTFIGAINLNPIGASDRLQIGCQLKREFWGQGFASELTARLLRFAMDELKLPAVYGVFEKDNHISRRLLEKLGFVFKESYQEQELVVETHKYTSSSTGSHTSN